MSRVAPLAISALYLLVTACASQPEEAMPGEGDMQQEVEGTFQYVGRLHGQSIAHDGRFTFLFGPADGSGPMIGEAGSYRLAGDTIWNTVEFSTDSGRIGRIYGWTYDVLPGDTFQFTTYNESGEISGSGRSVRLP